MSTRRNDIYFTSARIVGRAIEDVPCRLMDAFPRRWLGALSILLVYLLPSLPSSSPSSPSLRLSRRRLYLVRRVESHALHAASRHSAALHHFLRGAGRGRSRLATAACRHPCEITRQRTVIISRICFAAAAHKSPPEN